MNLKNNTNALKDKSNYDLNRAWLLFKLISNPFISKLLTSLLQLALNLKLPIKFLVKVDKKAEKRMWMLLKTCVFAPRGYFFISNKNSYHSRISFG